MKRLLPLLLVLTLAMVSSGCARDEAPTSAAPTPGEPADLILINGRVYTLSWSDPASDGTLAEDAPHDADGWHPDAQALAIRDGNIIAVGAGAAALAHQGERTRVIDVAGATVLPGLIDSHTHTFSLAEALSRVSLFGVTTEEEAVERIVERARDVPAGEWIVGYGWDEGAWANRYPDMRLLTERVPDHPVFMRSLHGFAGWGNRMAFEQAGITVETPAPSGGEIGRFPNGEPNGMLLNRAVPLLNEAIPPPTRDQIKAQVVKALSQMARDGYVTVHDAGLDTDQMAVLEELEAADALPIRVYAMLSARDEALSRRWLARGPDADNDSFLVTRAVKAYYDGALGSRGARLLDDYADMPGHRGVSGGEYGFDQTLVAELMAAGFQVGIHAIGDAGNRETLDFIEQVLTAHPQAKRLRHRIEHAQVIHPDDFARFAELELIASMEPPHAVEDKTWAEERLGPERVRGAYAWRTLREAGARLTFNADNPGSDHSIFYGLHAALTRRDKQREPEQGWYPEQTLNVDEAVRAYTRWSAYASFREGQTGTLEPGRWGDVTVIDIDPFVLSERDPGAILDGNVLLSVVNGRPIAGPLAAE
jgi:predicted amidohydrolase YtcJ